MRKTIVPLMICLVSVGIAAAIYSVVPVEQAKLTANDGGPGDRFGDAVSIYGDTGAIGAFLDDDLGTDSGSVYIYHRTRTGWNQVAKLNASDGAAFDHFGGSLAINGDTIAVGALQDDDLGPSSGSVYVFMRTRTGWSEIAKLTPGDGAPFDRFGTSVALSGDTLVIGARSGDGLAPNSGAAYVFQRTGNGWTEQAKSTASDGETSDGFGWSVTIDGATIVIGANLDDDLGQSSGSAYVFERVRGSWIEVAKLTATDGGSQDFFGFSVGIGEDGIIGGAPDEDDFGDASGAVYVYRRTTAGWIEEQKLTASDGMTFDFFGGSVHLAGDILVVGASGADGQVLDSGAAYVFQNMAAGWNEVAKLIAIDGNSFDGFGWSTAFDGETILSGAPFDDDLGSTSGSAYIFNLDF